MLKRLALLGLVALCSCDADDPTPKRPSEEAAAPYAAVYFHHDGRLVPEYRRLAGGDAARAMWDLLAAGPENDVLTSSIADGDHLAQIAEPEEGRLLIELAEGFWSRPRATVYAAAAQIVYSMSSVEGGRAVTLIDGLQPGEVRTADGELLEHPLRVADFRAPLVQVVVPAPGATVGPRIPVELNLAPEQPVAVTLAVDGRTVASTTVRNGSGVLEVRADAAGAAVLRIELASELTIDVPLELANPQG